LQLWDGNIISVLQLALPALKSIQMTAAAAAAAAEMFKLL
jgi:hypothetical protein